MCSTTASLGGDSSEWSRACSRPSLFTIQAAKLTERQLYGAITAAQTEAEVGAQQIAPSLSLPKFA